MKLNDFPYLTTKGLAEYSDLVIDVINSFAEPSVGTIEEGTAQEASCGEDCLGYWDKVSEDICYGRYLQFKKIEEENIKEEPIKFWFGLSSTHEQANLTIWFIKTNITAYKEKLQNIFEPKNQYQESPDEIWITMEEKDFAQFCNNSSCVVREKTIKDFWKSVLRELN